VLPLFRVIVEPLSMAATLIWLIGASFVELALPLWGDIGQELVGIRILLRVGMAVQLISPA